MGMKEAKYLGAEQLIAFGDSELVIKKLRNNYQVKISKLKNYRNEVWDLIEHYFSTFKINFVTRGENQIVYSLAIAASNFKDPLDVKAVYDVQIKNRPSIPDNIKHWLVFEDDKEIQNFLECVEELANILIMSKRLLKTKLETLLTKL